MMHIMRRGLSSLNAFHRQGDRTAGNSETLLPGRPYRMGGLNRGGHPKFHPVHLLIAGFLIALFEEEQHVYDAYNEAWPLELERVDRTAGNSETLLPGRPYRMGGLNRGGHPKFHPLGSLAS
jgi:hypothetical protein